MFLAENWDFTLANYDSVWKFMVQIGLIFLFLLLGNIIRTVIPFLKKSLIPSSLLGGFLLLMTNIIIKAITKGDFVLVDKRIMQVVTYHGLALGFIGMSLKTVKTKNKTGFIKSVENGLLTGGTYMLQAFVGLAITVILFLMTRNTDNPLFYTSGVILPLGYGQGPGNALTWDITFSAMVAENGRPIFEGNGSFGLTIASMGFIVASVIGVLYINIMRHKGKLVVRTKENKAREIVEFVEENEIPDNESVDKFSIQLALVFVCYAIAFGIMSIFAVISDFTNGIAWGFNFIWGIIAAALVKFIINFFRKKNVIKKNYINNYQMDRISGFAFDIMIVAGVAAIEIEDVQKYLLPLILLCSIGAIVTYIYIRLVTKHNFKGYEHEMFACNFGALTGTASNGMILLKEIDPNFETPTANLYVTSQFPAIIFVAPLLLLLNFASKSFTNTLIATGIFFVLFVIYTLILFRKSIFKKKNKE